MVMVKVLWLERFRMIERARFLTSLIRNKQITCSLTKCYSEAATADDNERTTHFGFKTVKESEKAKEGGFSNLINFLESSYVYE